MKATRITALSIAFCSIMILTACGEGWETTEYEGVPYSERTAGTGIAYVRAVLMPEKGAVLEPQLEESAPIISSEQALAGTEVVEEAAPIESAQPLFEEELIPKK